MASNNIIIYMDIYGSSEIERQMWENVPSGEQPPTF